MKFNAFGRKLEVVWENEQWSVFFLGEGKKRKSDIVIPTDIKSEDIAQYLSDLFHESATPDNPEVKPIIEHR
ncbi:MAG: hypothetical protein COB97_09795 [Paracoccus sp.]|nr:MAG: hypothetical protein COB97_09795 [Paracoccus sp. (in: a-proteobacteria)]